jgi:superfamily I DNA/RNA helicase
MSWTEEQKKIIKNNDKLLVINACAGSGKTSTLLGIMKANKKSRILYMVFNSSMKKEAESKVKKYAFYHVDVKTGHGLAYSHFGRMNAIGNVSYIDIANYFGWGNSPGRRGYLRIIYSYYKKYLQSSAVDIGEFIQKNEEELLPKLKTYIKNASSQMALEHMQKIWDGMENKDICMTHDFYLKYFYLSQRIENKYDIVLLDEAQDTNEIMIEIINKKFPNARRIIVGDHNQAIYAWRGAVNAMEVFEKLENAKKLSLTNSFRVGTSTAKAANWIVNSKEDFLLEMKGLNDKQKLVQTINNGQNFTYLARTNAALFEYAVNNMNQKFYFNSKVCFDILKEVYSLYKGNSKNIKNPILKEYFDFDSLKFHVEEEAVEESEIKIAVQVVDKYKDDTIKYLDELQKNTTSKDKADVILSTVHASKGLEYEHIILADDYIDITKIKDKIKKLRNKAEEIYNDGNILKAKKLEDKIDNLYRWFKEECNILYVAITRSFGHIALNKTLLNSPIKKDN